MASSPSPSSSPSAYPPPPPASSASAKHNAFIPAPPESKPLSPPKKSPPFPWTHQETLALIQAYQEKWYSLKRGQLKAFQWEEVAVTVAARCGFDEPSKTATQCRHKIEKLRKRYRSELQKPNPNSWQYFEYMDQMERGPMSLDARPVAAAVKSFPKVATRSNGNHSFNHGSLYSNSADYYYNSSNNCGDDATDDSDEEWAAGYGTVRGAMGRSKPKTVNNRARVNAKSGNWAMEKGFNGSGIRGVKMLRDAVNGKRKQYYDRDATESGDEDDSVDDLEEEEEEEHLQTGDGGEGGCAGTELAAEIRGFAETFMRMENKKIEVMREMERCRMEMEKRRMDMILDAQRKIVDTIGRTFGSNKKANMNQET